MIVDAENIVRYEHGELDEEETVELFQGLVDSGLAWSLQGHYGRTAMALIEAGLVHIPPAPKEVREDLIGTHCECGAAYDPDLPGYACARRS